MAGLFVYCDMNYGLLNNSHNFPYFHVYRFPGNEKRVYKNKLTIDLDNIVYLGITLKDETNRHWKVKANPIIVKPPKPVTVKEEKKIIVAESAKQIKIQQSKFEKYRLEFDLLPEADKICCYCETALNRNTQTRDHLIAKSKGGTGEHYGHQNIRPCCKSCNTEKSNLLLRDYIFKINKAFMQAPVNSVFYKVLQIKIKNANRIAKEISNQLYLKV